MTEPDVASSDATNIAMRCELDGDDYVLNGEKWWSSGAGDPRCAIYIVMVRTGGDGPKHQQHSMILVPADTKGITKLRADEGLWRRRRAARPHAYQVRRTCGCRAANLILGEGRGFEIAQGRLGPGRIHHCMRAIGQAEMALELMCRRSLRREAFGDKLAKLGANFDIIAECRMEIEMARLLCLKAAWMMDQGDARAAAPWISQIKVVAPRVALKVIDEAVQMHGAQGISQDTPLARQWTHLGRCGWPTVPTPCIAARSRAPSSGVTPRKRCDPMKAIIARDFGPLDRLVYGDWPEPQATGRTVVIEAEAIGVNYPDGLLVQGLYQMRPPTPFVPGMEVAGRVVAIGPEVTDFKPGDRVAAFSTHGSYAERVGVDQARVMKLPDGLGVEDACALICGYGTSHYALKRRGLGKAGGDACRAWRVRRNRHRRCPDRQADGRQGDRRRLDRARSRRIARQAGADIVMGYDNLRDRLKEATGGNGVDVAFDPVGGDAFDGLARAMAWGGRLLVIGFASGTIPKFAGQSGAGQRL